MHEEESEYQSRKLRGIEQPPLVVIQTKPSESKENIESLPNPP